MNSLVLTLFWHYTGTPLVNKVNYKYLYKYRCKFEHHENDQPCPRLVKREHPTQQNQLMSIFNLWKEKCYKKAAENNFGGYRLVGPTNIREMPHYVEITYWATNCCP